MRNMEKMSFFVMKLLVVAVMGHFQGVCPMFTGIEGQILTQEQLGEVEIAQGEEPLVESIFHQYNVPYNPQEIPGSLEALKEKVEKYQEGTFLSKKTFTVRGSSGITLLHAAVADVNLNFITELLKRNNDPSIKTDNGNTVLDVIVDKLVAINKSKRELIDKVSPFRWVVLSGTKLLHYIKLNKSEIKPLANPDALAEAYAKFKTFVRSGAKHKLIMVPVPGNQFSLLASHEYGNFFKQYDGLFPSVQVDTDTPKSSVKNLQDSLVQLKERLRALGFRLQLYCHNIVKVG